MNVTNGMKINLESVAAFSKILKKKMILILKCIFICGRQPLETWRESSANLYSLITIGFSFAVTEKDFESTSMRTQHPFYKER